MPEQAIILASCSDGENLYPLTEQMPSVLLPVANRCLLSFQLELLENAAGFKQVLVVTEERWLTRLSTYVSETYKGPLKVEVIVVPEGAGSADALRTLAPKLHTDFVMIAGDVITDVDFARLADLHRLHGAAVTALLKEAPPRDAAIPKKAKELDGTDFIGIDERRQRLLHMESAADCDAGVSSISQSLLQSYPHLQIHTDLSDVHVYIFAHWTLQLLELKPHFASVKFELLPYLVRKQFLSKTNLRIPTPGHAAQALAMSASPAAAAQREAAQAAGFRCGCYVMAHDTGYCVRANTLATYTQANLDVARGGATHCEKEAELPKEADAILAKEGNFALKSFSQDSSRGFGVEVGARSSVKKSCVGPHCRLGSGVKLTNCILMDHVVVHDKVTMSNCIVCPNAEIGEGASLKDAQVGMGVTIEPGAVIKGEAIEMDRDDDE
eukprot:Transcript_23672.p2 GENE.Transcript_23672~~Transcript_23672.p2  ORF type:complete len:440 (-),score=222.48 Transcript_23672:35-1354(-)